ncbi:MAG: aromatic amino acid hydroxylase [Candidatus Zixiibacteriota bacterium]
MPNTQSATMAAFRTNNPQVGRLPNHLRQFAVDQRFNDYTPVDHAVWRYIMKQAVHILKENAHRVYFTGLLNTGINLEAIPRIEDMNDILGKIGWGAVAVDGFIPPAAFMEFQAYKVLVIACDMRQIHHIEYTPAPDIVHEAAGHAPIIVDGEYAAYLKRFGEVGTKAMSSKKDFELYQAIRHLSILKEAPDTDPKEVDRAMNDVLERQANLGEPSEMARLSRLHWWTVEYGLIGSMENPKIYGAGLLSSIGEAVSCLEENVKKIPYTIDAANYAFDITTKQPQLFVTPDFNHLNHVLDQFVAAMAYTVGGTEGLNKAIECANVCSCQFSSGLQLTGRFTEIIPGKTGQPVYLKTTGPSALAYDYKQVDGHGKDYHADGFGSPVGRLKGTSIALESMTDSQLRENGIETGKDITLSFDGGVVVKGHLDRIERRNGKVILLIISNCRVTFGDRVLYKPDWGTFDMAVGEKIVSVFSGAADKDAYDQVPLIPKERTIKVTYDVHAKRLHALYQQIRDIREHRRPYDELPGLWADLKANHPHDWLASMEILEILFKKSLYPELRLEIKQNLEAKARTHKELTKLIDDGLMLIV